MSATGNPSADPFGCDNMSAMKPHAPTTSKETAAKPKLSSGLPGTPAQQRTGLREAIKRHAETLRRLAR